MGLATLSAEAHCAHIWGSTVLDPPMTRRGPLIARLTLPQEHMKRINAGTWDANYTITRA